jgi:hypothetical protein
MPPRPRRLLFFPDYAADPIWEAGPRGGMVSLDELPLTSETRTDTRDWARHWERLACADQRADAYSAGMSDQPAEKVAPEAWAKHERDGRALCERLRDELGGDYELGWLDQEGQVEWTPGTGPEPRL